MSSAPQTAVHPSFAHGRRLSREPGVPRARPEVLRRLNEALGQKIICALRYRRHHFMAGALAARRIAEEFLVHSDEELAHADLLAERIVQLGGEPDFAPQGLMARNPAPCGALPSIAELIREDLTAERLAIESYRALAEYVGQDDPTTRRMLEGILGVEEAHAEELTDLL